MFEDLIKTITLHVPNSKLLKQFAGLTEQRYTRDRLLEIVKLLRAPLLKGRVEMIDTNNQVASAPFVNKVIATHNQSKDTLVKFLALMMSDIRNFQVFTDSLEEKERSLYILLLQRSTMYPLKDACKFLGQPIRENRTYYWSIPKLDLPFLEYYHIGYDKKYNSIYGIIIQPFARQVFYETLLPGQRDLKMSDELPEDVHEGLFELSTLKLMPLINALMEQGVLEKGANKFTAPSVKKAVKILGAEEFFKGDGIPKEMESMRGAIMVQSMGYAYSQIAGKKKRLMPEDTLLAICRALFEAPEYLYPILLSTYKGLPPSAYNYFLGEEIISALRTVLLELPVGKWADIDSIIRRAFLSTAYIYDLQFVSSSYISRLKVINKFYDDCHSIPPSEMSRLVGIPFVRGLLFFMAAWGWLDTGCVALKSDDVSPYDSLQYIRLTPLGAYVIGKAKTYTAPELPKDEVYFELDPERLIIRSMTDDNPYESLLIDTCTPIGNKRYKMNAETFLARCQQRSDVQAKIDFFKRYISGDLTPLWAHFFDSLLKRCNPLTPVSSKEYLIYNISPDNQQLIHLLMNDPVLRLLTIRAENYFILIEQKNKTKFDLRLRSLGYLL